MLRPQASGALFRKLNIFRLEAEDVSAIKRREKPD